MDRSKEKMNQKGVFKSWHGKKLEEREISRQTYFEKGHALKLVKRY